MDKNLRTLQKNYLFASQTLIIVQESNAVCCKSGIQYIKCLCAQNAQFLNIMFWYNYQPRRRIFIRQISTFFSGMFVGYSNTLMCSRISTLMQCVHVTLQWHYVSVYSYSDVMCLCNSTLKLRICVSVQWCYFVCVSLKWLYVFV
jgi:hypothetical protein